MQKLYCRTGPISEALGISVHLVRRLIKSGLIEAEETPGGQYRIPFSELERLKKEGLPPIPASPEEDDFESESGRQSEPDQQEEVRQNRLLAPPSNKVVRSAEDVVLAENQLKHLRIRLDTEETKDSIRTRKRQSAAEKAAQDRVAAEQTARADAEKQRRDWEANIVKNALDALPSEIPPETYLEARQSVAEALEGLGPQSPPSLPLRSAREAIRKVLAPWQRAQETSRAINEGVEQLPWAAKMTSTPTEWQVRAREAAADAISKLSKDSCYEDKLRVAGAAVRPIGKEFESSMLKRKILDGIVLWEGTAEERENARDKVRQALERAPVGTEQREFERIRDQALKPYRSLIEQRKLDAQKEQRVERLLGHISEYLDRLEADEEIEFDDCFEQLRLVEKLRPSIRRGILGKLKKTELTDLEIETVIEDLIDEYLDEHLE